MVVLDSAHGHSANVIHTVDMIKSKFPDLQVIAGNVATGAATEDLIKAGVDAVKVGIGPGRSVQHVSLQVLVFLRSQQIWSATKRQKNMEFRSLRMEE